MNQPLLVPRGSHLVLRAGLVTAVVLAFFGIATGILPVRCLFGACAAQDKAGVASTTTGGVATKTDQTVTIVNNAGNEAPRDAQAMANVAQPATAPTLTANDVVARSFALLPESVQKAPEALTPLKPLQPTTASAKTGRGEAGGLTTRSVHAVAIKPDGTPDLPEMADAYASAPSGEQPRAAGSEAVEAAAGIAEPTPAPVRKTAEAPAAQPAASKPAAADKPAGGQPDAGSSGVVKGGGVNVRSAPAKGNNSVLFALPGGAAVTIGESKNGWLHITDKDGRRGWVYKDFVAAR